MKENSISLEIHITLFKSLHSQLILIGCCGSSRQVFVLEYPAPLSNRYYRNVVPDIVVAHCHTCNKLFHASDFQAQVLERGACPFCRTKVRRSCTHCVSISASVP